MLGAAERDDGCESDVHPRSGTACGARRQAVHGDVTALLNTGLLSKTGDGMIIFPYDAIHVDFMLKAA